MGRTSMIAKLIRALTGASVKEAVETNSKTAADLKDALAKDRAKVDAEIIEKEVESRKAAHAAQGG